MKVWIVAASLAALSSGQWPDARQASMERTDRFRGRVVEGGVYRHSFGDGYVFALVPEQDASGRWLGWNIRVEERERPTNLAGMTPPWRGEGPLHVRPSEAIGNTRAAPQVFIFSPEVERTITWDMVDGPNSRPDLVAALLQRIEAFGRGELRVLDVSSRRGARNAAVDSRIMAFAVTLRWQRDVPRPPGVR